MSRINLKSYFETGDEPTQAEFLELIDECLNLPDDSVPFVGASVTITNKDHPMYGKSIVNPSPGNIVTFLKQLFFPFDEATVSINDTISYIELGVSNNIYISGEVTKNSETTFNNPRIFSPSEDSIVHTFAIIDSPISPYSYTDSGITDSKTYRTIIDVNNNGTPGEIQSSLKTVEAVIPFLTGANPTQLLDSTIYTNPNISINVEPKGSQIIAFDANEEYLHFAYPMSWGLPSGIVDNNGYPQTYGASGSGEDWEYVERTIVTPYWTKNLYIFTQGPTTVQGNITFNF